MRSILMIVVLSVILQGCATNDTNQVAKRYFSGDRVAPHQNTAGGVALFEGRSELPQYLSPPPNDATLSHYYGKWLRERNDFAKYRVSPAATPSPFEFDLEPNEFLAEQLRTRSILSYLFYTDGAIKYDGLAPNERFSFNLNDSTPLRSNSVGKSFVAYVVGHAICAGHIESLDIKPDDWPLLTDTVYGHVTLRDIMHMRAGDQTVVTEDKGLIETGRWFNQHTIASFAKNELKGSRPTRHRPYNYNGLATNIVMSYAIYRSGDDWDALLNHIFQEKAGIGHTFEFSKLNGFKESNGRGWYSAYATRYDYLRIARAMLTDWREDTCVGQYLKDLYANRKPMHHNYRDPNRLTDVATGYTGFFLTDLKGMKDRAILGMSGNNGQSILIDFDNERIAVANTAHTNYDWNTLVYRAIRDGRLP